MNGRSNDFDNLVINGISIQESDFSGEELENCKRFELRGTEFSVSPRRDCDIKALIVRQKAHIQASVPPGRVQNIFDTAAPLAIIIPAETTIQARYLSAGRRIAHNIDTYLKLDSEIILDTAALDLLNKNENLESLRGNLIILGGHENALSRCLLGTKNGKHESEFSLDEKGKWNLRGLSFDNLGEESLGLMFTHPHPLHRTGLAVFIAGTDQEGFERALRLFPIRTGM